MWLIRIALRRPLTVVVAVISVGLLSVLALLRMPIDIFPNLNLPVIYVAQPYGGMSPAQMEGYLVYYYENQSRTLDSSNSLSIRAQI
jgi:multidrug efflux pump subunit AcrB